MSRDGTSEGRAPQRYIALPTATFGQRLRWLLTAERISSASAARTIGVSDQTWRNWEDDKAVPRDLKGVSIKITEAWGYAFDHDIAWIALGDLPEMPHRGERHEIGDDSPSDRAGDARLPDVDTSPDGRPVPPAVRREARRRGGRPSGGMGEHEWSPPTPSRRARAAASS